MSSDAHDGSDAVHGAAAFLAPIANPYPMIDHMPVATLGRAVLVALVVAVLSAALLEGAARLAGLAPPLEQQYGDNVADPHLPFKKRPGSVVRARAGSGEFEAEYRHNSLGFRDVQHDAAKPPGVFRVVAVGDSFTYGVGAAFEDTYLAQLERRLNPRGAPRRVEIVKLGLPRYFPALEARVLERYGVRFEPDLVLVAVLPNDVLDTALGTDAVYVDDAGRLRTRDGARLGALATWLAERSHAVRAFLGGAVARVRARASPLRPDDVYRADGAHEADWRRLEADLGAMREQAARHGARFVLVGIPQRGPWGPRHEYPERRLAAWAGRHDAVFVGTIAALRAAGPAERLYWTRDGHCTPAGYAAVAGAIATVLIERGLVP